MNGGFLYIIAAGVCAGIAAGLIFSVGIWFLFGCLGIAAACIIIAPRKPKKYAACVLTAALFAALALGLVRADFFNIRRAADNLASLALGQSVTIDGKVSADPDERQASLHATIAVSKLNGAPAQGKLIAFLPTQTALHYNDSVVLRGILAQPRSFQGDSGNEFDYPGYLEVRGVSATLMRAQVLHVLPGGWSLFGTLYYLKERFNSSLEHLFPEPNASLLEGILLGERRGLSPALTSAFVAAGLIHIVILAGYVLSIVAEAILRALRFLPRRSGLVIAAALLILFVLMTGASATAVRACIMALVAILARYFDRPSLALRSLSLAVVGMVLWNPPILLHDGSFIISVLATFGLITLSPAAERWLRFLPEKYELRTIATSTLCVQIFALPALLYYTGNLSFFSVPANLLALPALPWVMLFGFLAGLLNFANSLLAFLPAAIAYLLLKWILLIVSAVQAIPYSSTTIFSFPAWAAVTMYIPLIAFAIHTYRKDLTTERR